MDSNNLRESVSLLKSLTAHSLSELNAMAVARGISIRSYDESPAKFLCRLYHRLSGRPDFDLAYSALSLIQTLREDPIKADPAKDMRVMLEKSVKSHLDEIKREDVRTDAEFMRALKCL